VALAATLTVVGAFFAAKALGPSGAQSVSAPAAEDPQDQWALDALARGDFDIASPEFASGRQSYRYSVVPGGTHNPDELRHAIKRDAVVAAHYANVDRTRLRTEVVPTDRYVHVSYRKGNEIFWTSKKVLLRKGETILTDGKTEIRARCGNCISEQPAGPTSAEEPDVVEFDRLTDALPRATAPEVALVPPAKEDPLAAGATAGTPTAGTPMVSVGGGGS